MLSFTNSAEFQLALEFFVTTLAELAGLFLLISFVVSFINSKLPPEKVKQMLSGNRGYGVAVMLGSITPFCSCSTLPMTIGLLKARASFGPVMAFLFTSPLLNPFIVGLFWVTFGAQVTLIYAIFVIGLAIASGMLLEQFQFQRFIRQDLLVTNESISTCSDRVVVDSESSSCSDSSACSEPDSYSQPDSFSESSGCCDDKIKSSRSDCPSNFLSPWNRFRSLVVESFKQFVSFVPYMALGVAIGAVLHGYVPTSFFTSVSAMPTLWLIPLTAIIGVFLYVRASTMVPIAASLAAKGMSLGAIMSLTIGGAGASLPEMIMLKRMFHWPLLIAFIFLVFFTACLTGFVIELV